MESLPILGTFSDGKVGVRQEDIDAFLAAGNAYTDIPDEIRSNMRTLREGAYSIDWRNGSYLSKNSRGSVFYTLFADNGSISTRADSMQEAQAKALEKNPGGNWLFQPGSSSSYSGSFGSGVTPTNTDVPATEIPGVSTPSTSGSALENSVAFQNLPQDQKDAVMQVYSIIAENNVDQAERLQAAFATAAEIADPFFKQQILLARDAIERGFVSIDQEAEFQERQYQTRLSDLRQDLEARKEFLNLEETAALKGVEREYEQNQKVLRQNMAARGMTSSSERFDRESLLEETTGDLRETTSRRFGVQRAEADRQLERGQRDTQREIDRLAELNKSKKTELFREAEATLGTDGLSGLPTLGTDIDPIGGIVGDIPQKQTADIIQGAQNLIF